MTAVVCAAFDAGTDAAVLSLRAGLCDAGVASVRDPRHRPHLTLAAARVRPDSVAGVAEVAARIAATHAPVPIVFETVGRFGRAGAIWLGPASQPRLTAVQHDVRETLIESGWPSAFGEQSDPATWVAHCTLVTRVDRTRLRSVQAALQARFTPIAGRVEALATIIVGGAGDVALAPLSG